MPRYIDAHDLRHKLMELNVDNPTVYNAIWDAPTADVLKVVRCKNCKYAEIMDYAPTQCRYYCRNSTNYHSKDFYCSMGEEIDYERTD